MADVVFNVPVNMLTKSVFWGRVTEGSGSRIVIQDGGRTGVYEGSFTYNLQEEVFGSLYAYSEYQGGSLSWAVAGLNYNANTAFHYISNNMLQGLFSSALAGNDTIRGSYGPDVIFGGAGNDLLAGMGSNDEIRGDAGIDTALFQGRAKDYTISTSSFGIQVRDSVTTRDGTDTLISVERLKFSDVSIALDTNGNAGEAYRLYQAAFDRTPDIDGLSYWIRQLDRGLELQEIAAAFIGSSEFQATYGQASDASFITLIYQNVLNRAPDTGGAQYWSGQLARGMPREEMLVGFSESPENQSNTAAAISKGIMYFDLA